MLGTLTVIVSVMWIGLLVIDMLRGKSGNGLVYQMLCLVLCGMFIGMDILWQILEAVK